jgi:hypothetical protein
MSSASTTKKLAVGTQATAATTKAAITAPTDLAESIVAINAIITVLEQFGLVAAN